MSSLRRQDRYRHFRPLGCVAGAHGKRLVLRSCIGPVTPSDSTWSAGRGP